MQVRLCKLCKLENELTCVNANAFDLLLLFRSEKKWAHIKISRFTGNNVTG